MRTPRTPPGRRATAAGGANGRERMDVDRRRPVASARRATATACRPCTNCPACDQLLVSSACGDAGEFVDESGNDRDRRYRAVRARDRAHLQYQVLPAPGEPAAG